MAQTDVLMLKSRILVVDDDNSILKLLDVSLRKAGYEAILASSGQEALDQFCSQDLSLVTLDVRIPGLDGFEVCRRMRESSEVPIIMLTASSKDSDVIRGLECGADDYVTKPFSLDVFMARIRTVIRRAETIQDTKAEPMQYGELVIDSSQHRVSVGGKEVKLTATEFKLLSLLANNAGRIFTRDQLLEKIWGWEYLGENHILHVVVSRMREKLSNDANNSNYILTKVGVGYMFNKLW